MRDIKIGLLRESADKNVIGVPDNQFGEQFGELLLRELIAEDGRVAQFRLNIRYSKWFQHSMIYFRMNETCILEAD